MLRRRLLYPLAVVLLLGQMAFAMVTTAVAQSPTIDEPVYVATAEVYRQQQARWHADDTARRATADEHHLEAHR